MLRTFGRLAIPVFLAGAVGWSIYALSYTIGARYYLYGKPDYSPRRGTGIVVIVLHAVVLLLFAFASIRLATVVLWNPGYTQVNSISGESDEARLRRRKRAFGGRVQLKGPEPYLDRIGVAHHSQPTPPGLEYYMSKDVYACEPDGLPAWCNYCWNWKPDRTHHSSALGRCVRRFDHYCPWIGGAVSEPTNKFFLQFAFYFAFYLAYVFAIAIYTVVGMKKELRTDEGDVVHWGFLAGISGFGGLIASSIVIRFGYLAAINQIATEETIGGVIHLAVKVSEQEYQQRNDSKAPFQVITFPLPGMAASSLEPRRYAILQLKHGGNPWNLGPLGNIRQIMGTHLIDWFLPLRYGPVCCHDGKSEYALGRDFTEMERVFFPDRYRKRSSRSRRSSVSRPTSRPRSNMDV